MSAVRIERWTRSARVSVAGFAGLLLLLSGLPMLASGALIDHLTTLFIYITLALLWNALAGYGGLVSVGQQAFFGLGAYAAIRLAQSGMNVFLALPVAALAGGAAALGLSVFVLRLRGGEFAIGMWVIAELLHLLVNLDPLIQGETGTSLIQLNAYDAASRHAILYWLALAAVTGLIGALFLLLRGATGIAIRAIRDDEAAAASLGVRVPTTKRLLFVLAAAGTAFAGALWLAAAVTFQPKTYFGVQWTAYMIFMVLVGGLGTFEGPILGAILFFLIETWFGGSGVWYLVGLGGTALGFALALPQGLWGALDRRVPLQLLPLDYRLSAAPHATGPHGTGASATETGTS